MKKDIYSLKKGDRIRILNKPHEWSSHFSNNNPLNGIQFPTTIIIKKMQNIHIGCDGGYGWSLNGIQYAGYELLSEEEHFLGFI